MLSARQTILRNIPKEDLRGSLFNCLAGNLKLFQLKRQQSFSTAKSSKLMSPMAATHTINNNNNNNYSNNNSASLGHFKLPTVKNEILKTYAPGSKEREELTQAIKEMSSKVHQVPCIVNGKKIMTNGKGVQVVCANHRQRLCEYHQADGDLAREAISGALAAKSAWETLPWQERAAIFMKAADLLSSPRHRYRVMAASILGQGKNAWQAEIDAAAELADFWRFNCAYAEHIYAQQPEEHAPGTWNRIEYRPLEGFVVAISPFNFTAIGGNLASAPALMGNVVVWKPSASAVLSNYLVYEILMEAGLPPGVIQFLPGPSAMLAEVLLTNESLAGIHFTGSTEVFKSIWKQVGNHIDDYHSYPRLVGETGGKNFHFIHSSANIPNAVFNSIRSAFEYQGQKCSACSRLYISDAIWPAFRDLLLAQMATVTVGGPDDFTTFMGPVINESAYRKIESYIEYARQSSDAEILYGGKCDARQGYFVEPTIILTTKPDFKTMQEEIFGPVLTIFVYPEGEFEDYLNICANGSTYGLTGSFFATDRHVINYATQVLRNSAGNFYVNDKSTGAVVGQQPFGGARQSGTNDKAGSGLNLLRWVSPRTIKESFIPLEHWSYPSNQS